MSAYDFFEREMSYEFGCVTGKKYVSFGARISGRVSVYRKIMELARKDEKKLKEFISASDGVGYRIIRKHFNYLYEGKDPIIYLLAYKIKNR